RLVGWSMLYCTNAKKTSRVPKPLQLDLFFSSKTKDRMRLAFIILMTVLVILTAHITNAKEQGRKPPPREGGKPGGPGGKPPPREGGKTPTKEGGKPLPREGGKPGGPGGKPPPREGGKPPPGKGGKPPPRHGEKPREADGKLERTENEKKRDEARSKIKDEFKTGKKESQRDREVGSSTLRCDKRGGALIIRRKGTVFGMNIKDIITRDENNVEVKKFNIRDDVDFSITKDKNDTSTYGIEAAFVEMAGQLTNNGGNITLQVFMFKDAGNVTGEDGNEYELVDGGVKFNLKIDLPETVKALDVVLSTKCGFKGEGSKKGKPQKQSKEATRGKKGPVKNSGRRDLETFEMCSNSQMTFSAAYQVGGNDIDMPSGYPESNAVDEQNEKLGSEIVLRFENAKNIFYDPTAETGDDIGDPVDYDTGSSGTMMTSSVLILSCLMMLVKMLM
uniref:Uncharacterized protein n=2 Tax=Clytia hemisphaerica TaxID=252671 RepID=A0A7M5XNT6_9CNID